MFIHLEFTMKALSVALVFALSGAFALADEKPKPEPKEPKKVPAKAEPSLEIPYRLTDTKHVLVRAKLNGKGPFNFILDTGAPAVFIPNKVAKKVGLTTDQKGWGTFDTFEIEGGLKVENAKGRVEDLFQLEGMNGMGLAGVELHGVIGYNVLAKYRITYDFTKDKLVFATLNFDPPEPKGIGEKGGGQGGLEMMGTMMKVLSGFMGIKPNYEVQPTGLLGAELEQKKDGVYVVSVLADGPAAKAGMKKGDKLEDVKGSSIDDFADLNRVLGKSNAGSEIKFTILRGEEKKSFTLELAKGL